MNINVREVHKNDYDQIKDLHSKFNLNILNHDEWIKFWFKNPCFLESNETIPLGWVVEDNNKKIVGYLGNIFKEYYIIITLYNFYLMFIFFIKSRFI